MSIRAIKLFKFYSYRTTNYASRVATRFVSSVSQNPTDRCDTAKTKQSFVSENLKSKVDREFKESQPRVFTVPNILTFSRMATAPAIGYFIYNGMNSHALACFAFAATTDFLDGFIARRFKQSSDLGTMLDPIADKMLLVTSLVAMYNANLMPLWFVRGIFIRDFLILAGATGLRYQGFSEPPSWRKFFDFKNYPTLGIEPTLESKCSTALQCLIIILRLATYPNAQYDWHFFGLEVAAATFATISLGQYLHRAYTSDSLGHRTPQSKTKLTR